MKSIVHSLQVISIVVLVVVASQIAAAQNSSIELSCRSKAKEVANETYKTCVTESKQAQLEKIRTDYQTKLKELKDYYDAELRKVSGKPLVNKASSVDVKKQSVKKSTTPAPVARAPISTLPAKENISSAPTPMAIGTPQSLPEVTPVAPEAAPPMSVELRPTHRKEVPYGFEDETIENPIQE